MERAPFCPLPWGSICIQPFGVTLCCSSGKELREHPDQTPLAAHHGRIKREVRQRFLDGQWPDACGDCQRKEERGFKSPRQLVIEQQRFAELCERRSELGADAPEFVTHLEIAPDNRCNMKCRMCNLQNSSKWDEDAARLAAQGLGELVRVGWRAMPVGDLDLDGLARALGPNAIVTLKGGEPLVNPKLLELLDLLVERGLAGRVALALTTNATVLPRRFLERAHLFEKVYADVSIDALDPLFRYVRSGRFDYEVIRKNLVTLVELGAVVKITTAFQIYNMLSYDTLVRALRPLCKDFVFNWVMEPWLSATAAPDALRAIAGERLQRLLDEETESETSRQTFAELLLGLRQGRFDAEAWSTFRTYTAALDGIRGESLAAVEPELWTHVGG